MVFCTTDYDFAGYSNFFDGRFFFFFLVKSLMPSLFCDKRSDYSVAAKSRPMSLSETAFSSSAGDVTVFNSYGTGYFAAGSFSGGFMTSDATSSGKSMSSSAWLKSFLNKLSFGL